MLDNVRADYSRLTWDDSGTAVAALRGMDRRGFTEKENALVAFSGLDGASPTTMILARAQLTGLPDSLVISEKGTLSWSPDRSKIFVGLKEQEARPQPVRDSTAVVEPVGQCRRLALERPVHPVGADGARAAGSQSHLHCRRAACAEEGRSARRRADGSRAGHEGRQLGRRSGRQGVRRRLEAAAHRHLSRERQHRRADSRFSRGRSAHSVYPPDGKYFLYWKDSHVWSYNIANNTHANITKSAPVSFVNAEEDHVGEKPAYGITGFSKDGKSVILEPRYDLWDVALDGSGTARNLTNGFGAKNAVRLRYQRLDPDESAPRRRRRADSVDAEAVAATERSTSRSRCSLTALSDADKKAGFYQLEGDKLTKIVIDDHVFGRPIKAKNADRVLMTRETFVEFPDYWVTDSHFANPQRLTNANPQQAEFKWGHRILFDFKDKDGHKLQGTLAIPDDYQPGQKLPMLVDFYEKNSQNLNHYEAPRYANSPQYADYVSNGYLVMVPDIYYHTGRSHTDMLNSIEAAVKKVEDMGYADPKRVGLHGHSYSGQGAAYVSTQSKMFAAVVAGAAAVDLIADFNQLWKTSGTNQHRYDTYGQGRFGTNPYENLALFQDQSAVFHAQTMNTPLLIEQGTNDGSTEWLQGVEFYNALRFLKKPVIFLSYEGEAHGYHALRQSVRRRGAHASVLRPLSQRRAGRGVDRERSAVHQEEDADGCGGAAGATDGWRRGNRDANDWWRSRRRNSATGRSAGALMSS